MEIGVHLYGMGIIVGGVEKVGYFGCRSRIIIVGSWPRKGGGGIIERVV